MAGMAWEVLGVEENRCLQEVHLELRELQVLRMGAGLRVEGHRDTGVPKMVHPVQEESDVMTRLPYLAPKRAQIMKLIRQYWRVH